jgi:hypothetical protein
VQFPRHVQAAVPSQLSAHAVAPEQFTEQTEAPLQLTPQSVASPQLTLHGELSLHVTAQARASSQFTWQSPPLHVLPHDATSAHCVSQLVALHAQASPVQMQIPPEQSTSGSGPQPATPKAKVTKISARMAPSTERPVRRFTHARITVVHLRLRNAAALDPLAVPLPHGTIVVTRVDRALGEKRIPAGAIGRVVSIDADGVTVRFVGTGDATYARTEVVPRKLGERRFALARAANWETLSDCAVLESTVGSRAWNLAGDESDEDRRGLFALPLPWTAGLAEPPTDLTTPNGSTTLWEVRKGLKQALRADPNTLEMLFVPTARALDEIGEWILAERDAFPSADVYGSFGRYALAQLDRLSQSMRLAEHRHLVLEWLRAEPTLDLDAVAARLAAASSVEARTPADATHRAKEWIKQLYRSLHDQGVLPASDFASLGVLARDGAAALALPRELRPKNAYNLLRLLATAIGWLRSGEPRFAVEGTFRERLFAIKRGEVPLSEVLAEAETLAARLEEARLATTLPPHPDLDRVDRLLRRIGQELARRWIEQAPGPFGRDAPPPPPLEWKKEP